MASMGRMLHMVALAHTCICCLTISLGTNTMLLRMLPLAAASMCTVGRGTVMLNGLLLLRKLWVAV